MTTGLKTVVIPVEDLAAAKAVYTALLGVEPSQDQPYYVGFDVAGQHLGLDPNGARQGNTQPISYWHVDDISAAVEALTAAGATEKQAARDVGAGRLIATLTDTDGHPIGLLQDPS